MKHTLVSAAVGAIAATLVAGGVAWATIPAANGVINACYRVSQDDQKGQVRLVNDAGSCRNNEAQVSWSQVGLQGERGPRGEQGSPGLSGYEIVTVTAPAVNAGSSVRLIVTCPNGKSVLGGGAGATQGPDLLASFPAGESSWFVEIRRDDPTGQAAAATAYAVCAFVD